MPAKSASLYASQVDALEHLAKSDLERTAGGWIVLAEPRMPVFRHVTVRSLADRGLCRIARPTATRRHVRPVAEIMHFSTQAAADEVNRYGQTTVSGKPWQRNADASRAPSSRP